jgi:hypothetical protein
MASGNRTGMQGSPEGHIDIKALHKPACFPSIQPASPLDLAPRQFMQLEAASHPIEGMYVGNTELNALDYIGCNERHIMAKLTERLAHLHYVNTVCFPRRDYRAG